MDEIVVFVDVDNTGCYTHEEINKKLNSIFGIEKEYSFCFDNKAFKNGRFECVIKL